jgi:hypothetical protein
MSAPFPPSPGSLSPLPLDARLKSALKIVATPERYKVCAGCESIVGAHVTGCPNCHGYRFIEGRDVVIAQAKLLASRPQQSVTASDLEG